MDSIKKIVVYYFSGTGNAKKIALWFSEFASQNNLEWSLVNIAKTDMNEVAVPEDDALLIFISPIHGFNFPETSLKFIRHFPRGSNRVVLMCTRGGLKIGKWVTPGLTGIAFILSSFWLKKKGYKIVGQIPFDMPSNWISLHPALRENAIQFLYNKNYQRVQKHAAKIFSGKTDFHSRRDIVQDLLIAPVSLAYYFAGKFILAKSFYATYNCDGCGICIKQCPAKAIKTVNGKPFWTFKCESCMRCINTCPQKAVETAHGLMLVVTLICSLAMSAILANLNLVYLRNAATKLILFSFLFFFLIWPLYKLQHFLLRTRLFGKLIAFSSLTYYRFWGRYKAAKDGIWKKKKSFEQH